MTNLAVVMQCYFIRTVWKSVALYPLAIVNTALSCNRCNELFSAKVNLNPLILNISTRAPGLWAIQSSMLSRQTSSVLTRWGELWISNITGFQSKRHVRGLAGPYRKRLHFKMLVEWLRLSNKSNTITATRNRNWFRLLLTQISIPINSKI